MGNIKRLSPMQPIFWISKGLTEEEAKYKIRSFRKMNEEYWITRGFSADEAKIKIKEFQSDQSNKYKAKRIEDPNKYKSSFNTNVEYWIKQGFSAEEAILKLSERQTTFSLSTCIDKHGEIKGRKIFLKRQSKWQQTLYENKTNDEIADMNRKKDCVSVDFFIRKGYSIEEAINLNKDAIMKRMVSFCKASKESLIIFIPFYEHLLKSGYSDNDIFFGYDNKKEWYIWSNSKKRIFFYDFCIRSKKIIIEFQGSKFHYNKDKHGPEWKSLYSNQSISESLEIDETKRKLAERNGFTIIYVWDTDDINETLIKLKNII
jgi:hypothetical protein